MPNELWYWEKHVPEDLILAVKQVRNLFDDACSQYEMVTSECCYAVLHPEVKPSDDLREFTSALTILKVAIGPISTQFFHDLLKRETPSATLAAFFHFYKALIAVRVKSAYQDLLEIGSANAKRLEVAPIAWAEWQGKSIINRASYQTGLWLKRCCDVETYDPGAPGNFDKNAGEEEERVWTSWRAPRLALMQPALGTPYEPLRVWEREDEETSLRVLKAFKKYFVIHLEAVLKNCVGAAHVELAKRGTKHSPSAFPEKSANAGNIRDVQTEQNPTRSASDPTSSIDECFSLSEDSRHVRFDGKAHTLTQAQSQMMKVLWDAHKSAHPVVGKDKLLATIESETSAVRDIWRDSPLWKTLIVSDKKGTYRLNLSKK